MTDHGGSRREGGRVGSVLEMYYVISTTKTRALLGRPTGSIRQVSKKTVTAKLAFAQDQEVCEWIYSWAQLSHWSSLVRPVVPPYRLGASLQINRPSYCVSSLSECQPMRQIMRWLRSTKKTALGDSKEDCWTQWLHPAACRRRIQSVEFIGGQNYTSKF